MNSSALAPIENARMSDGCRLSQRARLASGQPIGYLMHKALSRPELISMAAGFVDPHSLPVDLVAQVSESLLADRAAGEVALQYGTTHGDPELREAILERHLKSDGIAAEQSRFSLDQLVVTAGSNQMLHLLGETLLDPGDVVLCASPCYFVFLGALQNFDARSVGIASDDDGMIPEALEEELIRREVSGELGRVKAIYVASYYDNPSSSTLPADRRAKIVELAKRFSSEGTIYVIDDSAYRELRYFGEDIPSLSSFDSEGDTVIHTGSFSKSFSPGLRVGWGILPKELVEPVCNQKGNIDFGSPNLNQRIMAKVLQQGLFDPHVERLHVSYREKLEATVAAVKDHFGSLEGVHWVEARGGLYVWLTLPESVDTGSDGPLFDRAMDEGMLYLPGEYCFPAEGAPVPKNTIRLSFGTQTPARLAEGVASLARAVRHVLASL